MNSIETNASSRPVGISPGRDQPARRRGLRRPNSALAAALAAIGLSTDVRALRRTGPKPMVLGLALWAGVTSTALILIWLTR